MRTCTVHVLYLIVVFCNHSKLVLYKFMFNSCNKRNPTQSVCIMSRSLSVVPIQDEPQQPDRNRQLFSATQ